MADECGYSQNEINLMMNPVHEKLDAILREVEKTNGRVNCLEGWRNKIQGGFAILVLMFVPVFLKVIYEWIH